MRFGSRVFPFDRFLRHVSYRILMKDEANGMGLFISFFLGGGGGGPISTMKPSLICHGHFQTSRIQCIR